MFYPIMADRHSRSNKTLRGKYREFFIALALSVLLLQFTTVVDTIIVGNLLGTVEMSGVRVATPVIAVITVVATLVGAGCSTVASIALGRRDKARASRAFTLMLALTLVLGGIFIAVGVPLGQTIAHAICPDPEIADNAGKYITIVLAASPCFIFATALGMVLRADGFPKLSMALLMAGGLVNVVFDLILMGLGGMKIEGSAIATDISMLSAMLIGFCYFFFKKRNMRIVNIFKSFGETKEIFLLSMKSGAPGALRLLFTNAGLIVINFFVGKYAEPGAIAILTVCSNVQLVASVFFQSGGQAAMPMAGVLYGEHDYVGVKQLMKYAFLIVLGLVGLAIGVIVAIPGPIMAAFGVSSAPSTAELAIRIYAIGLLPIALNYVMTYYYSVVQRQKIAMIATFFENLVFYVPISIAFIFPMGVLGVAVAFAISETLALGVLALVAFIEMKRKSLKGLFLLPGSPSEVLYDATIPSTDIDASQVADEVRQALEGKSDPIKANRTAVAVEEMIANSVIRHQGKKRPVFFDVRVLLTKKGPMISLRDNGPAFDPTTYSQEEQGEYQFDGIELIHQCARKVSYSQTLGMNLTIIEV